jgi:potassium efflux system protein
MKIKAYLSILALCLTISGALLAGALPLQPEAYAEEPATRQWTDEMIRQRSAEAASALLSARKAATSDNASRLGIDLESLEDRVRSYVEMEATYDGLLSEMQKQIELEKEAAAAAEEINTFTQRGMLEKPPYPLSYYDDLWVGSEALQQRIETTAMALKAAQRSADEATINWRSALDEVEGFKRAKSAKEGAREYWIFETHQLDVQLWDAKRRLHQLRAENLKVQQQIASDRADLSRRQTDLVRLGLAYDEKDLARQIDELTQRKKELQKGLDLLKKKKTAADGQWLRAQDRSRKAEKNEGLARLEALAKSLDQWRKTYQEAIDQHEEMLRLTDLMQEVWRKRYALLKQVPEPSVLLQWLEQSQQRLADIDRVLPIEQQRQNSLWKQTSALEGNTKAESLDGKPGADGDVVDALRQMAVYRLDYIGTLVASGGLEERLSREIDIHLDRKPITYRLEKLWEQLGDIWNYQVWVIDGRPLTVQMTLVALAILLIGIMVTKIVIHRFAKRILTRPQVKATTAATIEKLLLYLGYLLVVLFALRMVNIPLAAFAFLGGAVAIGLGFGAQNLINNFISGFIIMGEQPINIDDLIEVDGVLGQVEEIGARCTRVRTGENIHILVPNSSFLEKNITNWTLADRLIRANVTVGVAYGSPVDQVEALLVKACDTFDTIQKVPEPFALFTDFGDNALMFKVHFWIHVKRVIERRIIESKLRFRIDDLFRKANITIAFPQRDVHFDSAGPLRVQLLDSSGDTMGDEN